MVVRYALTLILVGHAIAHLPGFLVAWRLASLAELPYSTTVFGGRLDVGNIGIRLVGLCWLMAAAAFVGAALGVVFVNLALATLVLVPGVLAAGLHGRP